MSRRVAAAADVGVAVVEASTVGRVAARVLIRPRPLGRCGRSRAPRALVNIDHEGGGANPVGGNKRAQRLRRAAHVRRRPPAAARSDGGDSNDED